MVIEIAGHRGARGLMPENTLSAFFEACRLGADVIELDVVISADLKVVVSHDPWMSPIFSTKPDGSPVTTEDFHQYNIFKMNYDEIRKFDCGIRTNFSFPHQKSVPSYKPLLSEVISEVELFNQTHNLNEIIYLVEIKFEESQVGFFYPNVKDYCDLVLDVINKSGINDRIILQSFDLNIMREFKKRQQLYKLALLIENDFSVEKNISDLGFVPDRYSCYFGLLKPDDIEYLHSQNIKVIPWTVNEIADMKRLLDWSVDGIITDYPDRAVSHFRAFSGSK